MDDKNQIFFSILDNQIYTSRVKATRILVITGTKLSWFGRSANGGTATSGNAVARTGNRDNNSYYFLLSFQYMNKREQYYPLFENSIFT